MRKFIELKIACCSTNGNICEYAPQQWPLPATYVWLAGENVDWQPVGVGQLRVTVPRYGLETLFPNVSWAVTVTFCEAVVLWAPWLSVTRSVTVNVPPAAYVCDGFSAVDVAPSPKFQL